MLFHQGQGQKSAQKSGDATAFNIRMARCRAGELPIFVSSWAGECEERDLLGSCGIQHLLAFKVIHA